MAEPKPARVRYIKLGEGGRWENECIRDGIIRFGFGSASAERFPLCQQGKWPELTRSFIAAGKDRTVATRFTNETKIFFEDCEATLWITFIGERLYWGTLTSAEAQRHVDGDGVFRKVCGGWQWKDKNQEPLTKDRLSGALAKYASYRGTSCAVVDAADYVIRRIKGKKAPEVERAIAALAKVKISTTNLMRQLTPQDFETLVDLVFSASGWQRQGPVGKTQKGIDLDLILPSTNERAFVQVKSRTNSSELAKYAEKIEEFGPYDRMFYVYHTGAIQNYDNDDRVIIIGPEKLAEMILDAGLVNWLIRKTS